MGLGPVRGAQAHLKGLAVLFPEGTLSASGIQARGQNTYVTETVSELWRWQRWPRFPATTKIRKLVRNVHVFPDSPT